MDRRSFALCLSLATLAELSLPGCRSSGFAGPNDQDAPVYLPVVPKETAQSTGPSPGSKTEPHTTILGDENWRQIQLVSADAMTPSDENSSFPMDSQDDRSDSPTSESGLSLAECLALAVTQNPDLVTLRQTEHVGATTLGVAQTYPFNPFVQFQATPFQDAPQGGPGRTHHYVLLMQTIQLAHQQQFREESAASSLNSIRWNIHHAELLAVAQTERLYFAALYLQAMQQLAEADDRNNRQLLRILEKRLEAGEATAADVAIVRADTQSTRQQLQLAVANYQAALRDLARQIGSAPDQVAHIAGDLYRIDWQLPIGSEGGLIPAVESEFPEQLTGAQSYAVSKAAVRPDVMAARSDVDIARANLCLASASKTPDLQLGPYYQANADRTVQFGFRGQIDLPVINTGEPLERQRLAEHRQRIVAWQQTRRRAELEGQAAFDRYETALAAISVSSGSTPMDLNAELSGLETQFQAGEVDVTRVVQARGSLLQNQRSRLNLLNEAAQSAAALTGATGIPVEQMLLFNAN